MGIQKVDIRQVRLARGALDDPVAQGLDWSPLKSGGANFKTHELLAEDMQLRVRPSRAGLLFAAVFVVPGALVFFGGMPYMLFQGEWGPGLFMGIWGALFGGAGAYLLLGERPLCFDKRNGLYYRGKPPQQGVAAQPQRAGWLRDIYALQILPERVSGKNSSFSSYEINLVLRNGTRINVMDHGKLAAIEHSARELAAFLGVPVWQANH